MNIDELRLFLETLPVEIKQYLTHTTDGRKKLRTLYLIGFGNKTKNEKITDR